MKMRPVRPQPMWHIPDPSAERIYRFEPPNLSANSKNEYRNFLSFSI
jgi:hypothetical protein